MKSFKRRWSLLILCMLICLAAQTVSHAEGTPEFNSLRELQFFLQDCIKERRQTVDFILKDANALKMSNDALGQELVQMSAQLVQCRTNMDRQQAGQIEIRMEMVYRQGIRIADAWKNGDTGRLSAEEIDTLHRAETIVEEVKQSATNALSVEKALHDRLCKELVYQDMIRDDSITEPQRVLSAVGALMDGVANCQGYSDAFYLLGTMAGLQVDFQCGYDSEDRAHVWNTICLDGRWYALDVTADDPVGDDLPPGIPNYISFNLGRDFCAGVLNWPEHWEVSDIADQSDKHYYLSEDSLDFGRDFTDLESMAKYVYNRRAKDGQEIVYTLFMGKSPSKDEINAAIKREAERHSKATSWRFWYWDRGIRTYYIFQWTEF